MGYNCEILDKYIGLCLLFLFAGILKNRDRNNIFKDIRASSHEIEPALSNTSIKLDLFKFSKNRITHRVYSQTQTVNIVSVHSTELSTKAYTASKMRSTITKEVVKRPLLELLEELKVKIHLSGECRKGRI